VHYFNKINEVLVRQEKEVQNVLNVHVSLGYAEESKVKARGTKKKRTNVRTPLCYYIFVSTIITTRRMTSTF